MCKQELVGLAVKAGFIICLNQTLFKWDTQLSTKASALPLIWGLDAMESDSSSWVNEWPLKGSITFSHHFLNQLKTLEVFNVSSPSNDVGLPQHELIWLGLIAAAVWYHWKATVRPPKLAEWCWKSLWLGVLVVWQITFSRKQPMHGFRSHLSSLIMYRSILMLEILHRTSSWLSVIFTFRTLGGFEIPVAPFIWNW